MKIAYLGWSSMVWNDDKLASYGEWQKSNLKLPLEFSRINDKNHLTLVIDEDHGIENNVWFVESVMNNLDSAINSLKNKLNTKTENIGYLTKDKKRSHLSDKLNEKIKNWMISNGYDAVIWSDLETNLDFSIDLIKSHIEKQKESDKKIILEYIKKCKDVNEIKTNL